MNTEEEFFLYLGLQTEHFVEAEATQKLEAGHESEVPHLQLPEFLMVPTVLLQAGGGKQILKIEYPLSGRDVGLMDTSVVHLMILFVLTCTLLGPLDP